MGLDPGNHAIKDFIPLEPAFRQLEQLSSLMAPLKDLTFLLSGRLYVTSSLLYPTIYSAVQYELNEIKLDDQNIIKLRECLLSSLKIRFKYIFDNDMFLAVTFLNYRFRQFEFIKEETERTEKLARAIAYIVSKYDSLPKPPIPTSATSSTPPSASSTPSISSNSSIESSQTSVSATQTLPNTQSTPVLNDVTNSSTAPLTPGTRKGSHGQLMKKIADKSPLVHDKASSKIELEVKQYQNFIMSNEQEDDDDLDSALCFFQQYDKTFPLLGQVARSLFCITATSVPVESLFSQAGLIQTDLRNRLNPKYLDSLNFIKGNKSYF